MVYLNRKEKTNSLLWEMWRGGEFIHVRFFVNFLTYGFSGTFLIPRLLMVQLETWDVLQDGKHWSVSRSQAGGWKSEEMRKHQFEFWEAQVVFDFASI